MEFNSIEAKSVIQFINQTNRSVFLTGKAGTGKTTLLHQIIKSTHKKTVVVAPTGIAALNAGGVTIHSMFQLPFSGFIPVSNASKYYSETVRLESKDTLGRHFKMNATKRSVILSMELLIIDEVSMLRADLLDAMDFMLRKTRRKDIPFGGVQVLFIGDLLQLPPVVKREEWNILKNFYQGYFFFHSKVLQQIPPLYIELTKIFRQSDEKFISVLNSLRNNKITQNDVTILNEFVNPNFDTKKNKGYITLTTHNNTADSLNAISLEELSEKEFCYKPEIVGDFPEKIYPVDEFLKLKVGAQIMFIKNDLSPEKNYFNGKMGFIKTLSNDEILVHFPEENKTIEVEKYEWKNIKYTVNQITKEIEEEVLGTFVHYPIKLAWAITVHKSQGLTFDKAILDVSRVFLPGQAYVALSRLRSLKGLVLLKPIQMNGISNDQDVMLYAENKTNVNTIKDTLNQESKKFMYQSMKLSFNFSDIIQEWRNFQFSFKKDVERSEKTKHFEWADKNALILSELLEPSKKFSSQIDRLFHQDALEFDFILERIDAATNYFSPKLEEVHFQLLLKMEEIKRIKRVKEFFDELFELDELLTQSIFQLKKAKQLLTLYIEDKEINKLNLNSKEISSYKSILLEKAIQAYKKDKLDVLEDENDVSYYEAKKKKSKTVKKSTVEETFELWLQKNSIKEIAKIRKLTNQTITTHIGKLIHERKIDLSDILPNERILEIAKVFEGYDEESLSKLKENVGEKFTWDELKLYKASLD